MSETLCVLRNGGGMDLNRYVERTFKDETSAAKWRNRQSRNVSVVALPGEWRKGDTVPLGVRGRTTL